MRIALTFLISFLAVTARANMASPIQEGSFTSTPFISRHVDILQESLLIIPDDRFQTARFVIEYHIRANRPGSQIPLLFYASEFREQFKIWLDGREISLKQVPESYQQLEGTPFTDFGHFFEKEDWSETPRVLLEESPSSGFYVAIDDLKFFETDLDEGMHVIRVEYVADQWVDHSGWVKEYILDSNWFCYAVLRAGTPNHFVVGITTVRLDTSIPNRGIFFHLWLQFEATSGELYITIVVHKDISSTAKPEIT